MHSFETGDVVRVKGTAGPHMTVSRINGITRWVTTQWFWGQRLLTKIFHNPSELEKV
jgi:uncharacterized protein YodC (DUF2158 family)